MVLLFLERGGWQGVDGVGDVAGEVLRVGAVIIVGVVVPNVKDASGDALKLAVGDAVMEVFIDAIGE